MHRNGAIQRIRRIQAFTLLEILVTTAIFTLMLVITLSALGQASFVWRSSSAKIETFQAARAAFDLVTRNLSQATLNTYLDYDNPANPTRYLRKSDLRFVCGESGAGFPGSPNTGQAFFFQLPGNYTGKTANFGGLESLLNTCGYFVAFSEDPMQPTHLTSKKKNRFRLMQLLVPTEDNKIFSTAGPTDFRWFADFAGPGEYGTTVFPIADNIIALVVEPWDPDGGNSAPLAPDYAYNTGVEGIAADGRQLITANQLPPIVKITMVAIDEASAVRLDTGDTMPARLADLLEGKFKKAAEFGDDVAKLETGLSEMHVNYRIFTSAVPIRESKWSK